MAELYKHPANLEAMMHFWMALLFPLAGTSLPENPHIVPVTADQIVAMKNSGSDTLYVVNFWATWCRPCVKEMPYFEKLGAEYADKKVKVILVSLDRKDYRETVLASFVKKHKLKSTIWHLEDKDPNIFIPKISNNWQGSIPATLLVQPSKGIWRFYEQEFNYTQLESIIKPLIR